MAKYRKKRATVEATRWFMNGDHPLDGCAIGRPCEGKVVRYYRRPGVPGDMICQQCQERINNHGFIDTPNGGHMVCPGDWIVTNSKGEHFPLKPGIFEETYERVN